MWIASVLGFYSIAYRQGAYNVRARTERDAQNLIEAAGLDAEVLYLPAADYQYRVLVDAEGLGRVMQTLAASVDYPNFKDAVKHVPGQEDKDSSYLRVWSEMLCWGDRAEGQDTFVDRGLGEIERGWGGGVEPPLP